MLPRVVPRLSRIWVPNSRFIISEKDSHGKLIRAGILRPSVLGTFHMLPLGKRIQDKVEGLIAKHMEDTLGQWIWFYPAVPILMIYRCFPSVIV